MVFTWYFIGLVLLLGTTALFWPGWYIGYAFIILFLAWFGDRFLTLRRPQIQVRRVFRNPCYQNQQSTIEINLINPGNCSIVVRIKDEPPFEAKAPHCQGILLLPAQGEGTFSYSMKVPVRGVFDFGDLNLRLNGRLQLFVYQLKVPFHQKLEVYPDMEKLFSESLGRWVGSTEQGRRHIRQVGSGGELAELREYNPSDDYRKINWKVTAHRGKPFVNQFEPEKDQNVFLIFDTGRTLFDQITLETSRLDHILDSAILLAYNIQEYGDMIGALSFNSKIEHFLPVGKGKSHLQMFVNEFFDTQAVMVESDYRNAFNFLQGKINKRSLIFIYTDLLDNESSKELIQYLQIFSRRHLIICVLSRQKSLERLSDLPITDEQSAYLKGTALELLKERDLTVKSLSNFGIKVMEVDPTTIRQSVVQHYSYLKRTGLF
jgi:uncharacterized protein (DUF58 family)